MILIVSIFYRRRIIFYEDSRGNKPVLEFINRLKKSKGKDSNLLHHYFKKTQKTPRREIEKAKREWEDFNERSGIV